MKFSPAPLAVLALALTACYGTGSPKPITREHFFDNFKTVVASADKDGYTPYWLGSEFTAGGFTFRGPDTDDRGGALPGGGVAMSYSADTARGGAVILELRVYSPPAWEKDRPRVDTAATRYVRIAGQDAKLSAIPNGTKPVEELLLLLKFGDTSVLATARAEGAATPGGPDVNPLVDEATFIDVLRNIRPYPQ